jgi:LysM repeat protein
VVKIKSLEHLLISLGLLFMASFLYSETKPVVKTYPAQGSPPRKLEQRQDGHWTANKSSGKTEGYEVHNVKSGDTLWNIAQQYLKDPFLWPQVWEMNPNVANPHWIYPGDQILIKKTIVVMAPSSLAPSEQPVAQSAPTEQPVARSAPTETIQPAPATTEKKESPTVPSLAAPTPVASQPAPPPVALYSDLYCAGFFSGEKLKPIAAVIGGEESEHRALFSDHDIIYLSKGTVAGIKPGDELQIVRPETSFGKWGPQFSSANSKSKYGYYYVDVGRARVLFAGENSATAQVIFTCGEISVEDQAVPAENRVSPIRRQGVAFEKFAPPSGKTRGKIFMTKEFLTQVGDGNVVFADVGHKDNVQVGDYFRISRSFNKKNISLFNINDYGKHTNSFSEVRKVIGEAVVLRADEKISTCLVTYSTEEITLGDDLELE